jgi:hypothetical protein
LLPPELQPVNVSAKISPKQSMAFISILQWIPRGREGRYTLPRT